jgi:PadR family transcriptional regulator AphA
MRSDPATELLPGEWAVLGVIAASPAHGFAVARRLAAGGDLGRVWSVTRPRVYRAIADLAANGLVEPVGEAASERGPARVVYAVTANGRERLERWLAEPAARVRDVRSELLLKLALLDAAGISPEPLLLAQRARVEPALASLEQALAAASGFDAVLLRYRVAMARGVVSFIDGLLAGDPRPR